MVKKEPCRRAYERNEETAKTHTANTGEEVRDRLKEKAANAELPTFADYIQDILIHKAQAGESDISLTLNNLKGNAELSYP